MRKHDDDRNSIEQYPDMLRPDDVCAILGIGKSSMYKILRDGELKSVWVGGQYRVPKKCLVEFIDSQL